MKDSAFDIICAGLRDIGGWQKRTADHIMIKCPFHNDNTPSLGVYIASGMSVPIGSFYCFGCGEKGSWNKIAEKLKLTKIKDWNDYSNGIIGNSIVDYDTIGSMAKHMRIEYAQWPVETKWRSFEGSLIRSMGGLIAAEMRTDNAISVFFPVYVNSILRGGVKAALKKQRGVLSYVTTKGPWVKKYGLFGYDYSKKFAKNYIVLVEGPRDAMRLIANGIPAIAILGSNNFSFEKALIISSLLTDVVICLPDNDDAGKCMKALVKKHMSTFTKTICIKLPNHCKDPEEMSFDDIETLRNIIDGIC